MVSRPLLFYDSGAGGLPYLQAARGRLPEQRYVYLADRASFPLGDKDAETIRERVQRSVALALRRFDPRLVVIACNTASVVALESLRQRFSVPFVGVVPAVKPAALTLRGGKLAVIATRQTVSGPYLERLIREFAGGCSVVRVPVANLVEFAEYRYLESDEAERREYVRAQLRGFLGQEVRAVVLGCTHFLLLEAEFRAVLDERVALIDSREGVTRRIAALADAGAAEDAAGSGAAADLYLHGGQGEEERYRGFCRRFGLTFRGHLQENGR